MIIDADNSLSEKELTFISNKIRNEIRRIDDPCMDNFRFEKSITPSCDYQIRANSGCCGSTDIKIVLNKKNIFYFGFNYGH